LPEKPVKKPAFNLPAGFFNKTWVFSSPVNNPYSQISRIMFIKKIIYITL
jgi:hypothetical protein